ncbi:MAG: quinol:cytochrome C oxidoreductase [Bacteroidetes bacterium HGW-Bacteroidetes-1]|jgi:MFS family permease|nr:MAG: quinol:cytochrome C oxidoreductase [Bacteroidetes bacterium HGW-Bacteroidetes-1]
MENKTFTLTKKTIAVFVVMIAIGLIALAFGFLSDINGKRIAANLLLNSYYFLSMGLIGLFFVTVHTIAESGWHTSVQRIGEAMSAFIPVGGILLLILFISGGLHQLYEWTDKDHLDELLLKKAAYLNEPFFYLRFAIFFIVWSALAYYVRRTSIALDKLGDVKYLNKLRMLSAIFIVFYAVSSVVSSWDWLMSIDAHWFSTLYGWYVFISMLASGIALFILILFVLKKMGYMGHVNHEHVHDLGKYLFGFSIFWAYLWFSQYMLIWYANIPEETVYFYERHKYFENIFYVNLVLNFAVPFLLLMARNTKRMFTVLVPVAVIVFVGHWVDLYQLIMPGVVGGENSAIGFLEIGLTIGYLGLFMIVVFWALSKAPLVPKNHPYYKESAEYHTHY